MKLADDLASSIRLHFISLGPKYFVCLIYGIILMLWTFNCMFAPMLVHGKSNLAILLTLLFASFQATDICYDLIKQFLKFLLAASLSSTVPLLLMAVPCYLAFKDHTSVVFTLSKSTSHIAYEGLAGGSRKLYGFICVIHAEYSLESFTVLLFYIDMLGPSSSSNANPLCILDPTSITCAFGTLFPKDRCIIIVSSLLGAAWVVSWSQLCLGPNSSSSILI